MKGLFMILLFAFVPFAAAGCEWRTECKLTCGFRKKRELPSALEFQPARCPTSGQDVLQVRSNIY